MKVRVWKEDYWKDYFCQSFFFFLKKIQISKTFIYVFFSFLSCQGYQNESSVKVSDCKSS